MLRFEHTINHLLGLTFEDFLVRQNIDGCNQTYEEGEDHTTYQHRTRGNTGNHGALFIPLHVFQCHINNIIDEVRYVLVFLGIHQGFFKAFSGNLICPVQNPSQLFIDMVQNICNGRDNLWCNDGEEEYQYSYQNDDSHRR